MDFDVLVGTEGNDKCIITWDKQPSKWGFYNKEWGFCISSRALENRDWIPWFIDLWIVIGDTLLDSNIPKDKYDEVLKGVLGNIEQGARYTIRREKTNTTK